MIRCLIIAKNPFHARALQRQLPAHFGGKLDNCVFHAKEPASSDWHVTDEFHRITDWIELSICAGGNISALRDTVVVTDLAPLHFGDGSNLNPVGKAGDGWAHLLAMLILAFPETSLR